MGRGFYPLPSRLGPTIVGVRNLERLHFRVVSKINIRSALFGFVTMQACGGQTDRNTNRQNYES